MLPGRWVITRIPVICGVVPAFERHISGQIIVEIWIEVCSPVVHRKVSQGFVRAVVVGLALAVGSSVGQCKVRRVMTEITWHRGRGVPLSVGHEDVVTGPAGICVLRSVARAVRGLLPRRACGIELTSSFDSSWQGRALVKGNRS